MNDVTDYTIPRSRHAYTDDYDSRQIYYSRAAALRAADRMRRVEHVHCVEIVAVRYVGRRDYYVTAHVTGVGQVWHA